MTRPTTTGKAQDLITFTRSTTGTYLDSVTYGNELVTNGTFATDFTGWTDVSTGTGSIAVVSGQAQLTRVNLNNRGFISQGITVVAGATYIVQITEVSGQAYVAVGTTETGTTFLGEPLAAGENTFYITPNATSVYINVRGVADGVQLIDNVSVKEVIGGQGTQGTPLLRTSAINKPRIEYDASGNCLGLLVEEARTNKVAYSQDFTQSYWTKNELTVAPAPVAAPDGTMTATHAVKAGSNAYLIRLSTASTADRHSIWARTVSGTGTMYIAGTRPDALVTVTEEWQRLDVQSSNTNVYAASLRGDATLTEVYIWGSQVETGTFPTSYIPTSGSTVTRAKDIASLAVSEFGYNQEQGSVVAEYIPSIIETDVRGVFELYSLSGASNRVYSSSGNAKHWFVKSGGATVADFDLGTPDVNQLNKISGVYKKDDFAASLNGQAVSTDTSGDVPVGITKFFIGQIDSSFHINGHIKSIQYYPLRLSNAQLQALTV